MNAQGQERYFNMIDPAWSGKDRARMLHDMWKYHLDSEAEVERDIPLGQEDYELVKQYAQDPHPKVRAIAVEVLCEEGPVTWDDLETWILDQDKEVRNKAMFGVTMSFKAAAELCSADRARCVRLLGEAVERYTDHYVDCSWWTLAEEDNAWFDTIWTEIERLLDLRREDINSLLAVGFLEDALYYRALGPEDPHVSHWILGGDKMRKMVLLEVVGWLGLKQDNLVQIAQALTKDADAEIAGAARKTLKRSDSGT